MSTFHTIGHSSRSSAEFITLLRQAGVELVVDVRTIPASRANPQFRQKMLAASLADAGLGYHWSRDLGGLRPKSKLVPEECNAFWNNASFHNYADYALGAEFTHALVELIRLGRSKSSAIMCAEAVWWRCHRRIVTDYLLARGHAVIHILDAEHHQAARLTPQSVVLPDLRICYPRADAAAPHPGVQNAESGHRAPVPPLLLSRRWALRAASFRPGRAGVPAGCRPLSAIR